MRPALSPCTSQRVLRRLFLRICFEDRETQLRTRPQQAELGTQRIQQPKPTTMRHRSTTQDTVWKQSPGRVMETLQSLDTAAGPPRGGTLLYLPQPNRELGFSHR